MNKFIEETGDPAVLDVMEGLLKLCMEREEEIARLSKELQDLKKSQANMATALNDQQKKHHAHGDQKGVLVVDASEFMRSRLVNLLSTNGYRVVGEADNGLKAIALFKELHPSIVTMDIDMPVMDGYEATRQIRRIDPNAKVIVISQILDRSMILNALDAGAVDFLVKPVPIERLLQLLCKLVASVAPGKAQPAR